MQNWVKSDLKVKFDLEGPGRSMCMQVYLYEQLGK